MDIHIAHQGHASETTTPPPPTTTTLRSHFGSSRGHSWPGLSQWLPHVIFRGFWFEATRAAQHVWPGAGADGLVRTACVVLVGSATTTILRRTRLAATLLLRRLAALLPRLLWTGLRVGFVVWNGSWSRSGPCQCPRFGNLLVRRSSSHHRSACRIARWSSCTQEQIMEAVLPSTPLSLNCHWGISVVF